MISFKQKLSTFFYSLSLFKDLELKLRLKSKLKSELKLKLPLLSVLETIRAGTYQTLVDHKKDTWIATDLGKHNADYTHQLHDCFGWIGGSETY